MADWLGLLEPARGEGCRSGNRHDAAAPGENKFPSPRQNPIHISTTPTIRRRKRKSPGSTPPRKVGKCKSPWPIADWLGLLEPTRGEGCPSGHHRGHAPPGKDNIPSLGQHSFHTSTTRTTRSRKEISAGATPPCRVWKPQSHWPIADWLGLLEPARGEGCRSGQRRGHAAPGENKLSSPRQNPIHISITPTTREVNGDPPVDTGPQGVETPVPLADC